MITEKSTKILKTWKQPVVEKLNVSKTKGGNTNKSENKPGTQGPFS